MNQSVKSKFMPYKIKHIFFYMAISEYESDIKTHDIIF